MATLKNELGKKFGRLQVIARAPTHFSPGGGRQTRWECQCECGQTVTINAEDLRTGHSKSCGCANEDGRRNRNREKNCGWKGGRFVREGYVRILPPRNHPIYPNLSRHMSEHRLIMAEKLGRRLFPHETVHHKNGNREDNRIENLELRSGAHGKGAAVEDLISHAEETLRRYAPEKLAPEKYEVSC